MPGFVLLARPRGDGDPAMRIGYTVTKKIGNAVVRNRMKRRFRALARELLPEGGVPGADHVLIGRQGGIERPFDQLRAELGKALAKVARSPSPVTPALSRGPASSLPAAGQGGTPDRGSRRDTILLEPPIRGDELGRRGK